ncbi:hypothetical protein TWF730_003641 [Orbilia blumenaviensis]|uniref:Uncharacterized protein n=1 Tax=Orbilia blumenaviensis TaxID=1796055 RepID=A0AAV9U754_9PEZI
MAPREWFRDGTRSVNGPLDFTLGIQSSTGEEVCAYYVNRDVLLALSTRLDKAIEIREAVLRTEIVDYHLLIDPLKAPLLKSFATFINEGKIEVSHFRQARDSDRLLFLYNFADFLGCSLLKNKIVRRVKQTMRGIIENIRMAIQGTTISLEAEIVEWINAFYECSTAADIEECYMWGIVDQAADLHPAVRTILLGVRDMDHLNARFRDQVVEELQFDDESSSDDDDIDIGFITSPLGSLDENNEHFANIRSQLMATGRL